MIILDLLPKCSLTDVPPWFLYSGLKTRLSDVVFIWRNVLLLCKGMFTAVFCRRSCYVCFYFSQHIVKLRVDVW